MSESLGRREELAEAEKGHASRPQMCCPQVPDTGPLSHLPVGGGVLGQRLLISL